MQQAIDIAALPELESPVRIGILRSKWYSDIVDGLHAPCIEVLAEKGVDDIETHVLPGTFEFPFAANELAQLKPRYEALICLGVVVKGDTYHFEMIVDECVRGLGAVSRAHRLPIINEVLAVTDIQQARDRAPTDPMQRHLNKGAEAAVAAIEVIAWRQSLQRWQEA